LLSLRWFESIVFRKEKKKREREGEGGGREEKMRGERSGCLVVAAAPRAFHPRAASGIGSMPDHVAKRAKNASR